MIMLIFKEVEWLVKDKYSRPSNETDVYIVFLIIPSMIYAYLENVLRIHFVFFYQPYY
jgi:hypothetical protein